MNLHWDRSDFFLFRLEVEVGWLHVLLLLLLWLLVMVVLLFLLILLVLEDLGEGYLLWLSGLGLLLKVVILLLWFALEYSDRYCIVVLMVIRVIGLAWGWSTAASRREDRVFRSGPA